jgi:sugar O-acyltransferase (sialic acid O-acetyltransferase NeuD family)
MKQDLYIIGAGSVGGHLASNWDEYGEDFNLLGFFDDDKDKIDTVQYGHKVLGPVENALKLQSNSIVIGIAFPKIKKRIVDLLSVNSTLTYPTFIHKDAWVSAGTEIGRGCIIYPGTSINYGCKIDDFVVMNMNCAIGHHTTIGKYTSLAPGVNTGGHTTIENIVDIGIGASTIQDIKIGSNCVIGGQSMVITDIPPGKTVAGIPAKSLN